MSERFLFTWRNAFREHGPSGLTTRAVGLALSMYADTDEGVAKPKQSRLAGDLDCATNTISTHLDRLAGSGWVKKRRSRYGCTYRLAVPDDIQNPSSRDSKEAGFQSRGGQNPSSRESESQENGNSDGQNPSSRDSKETGFQSRGGQNPSSRESESQENGLQEDSQGTPKELSGAAAARSDTGAGKPAQEAQHHPQTDQLLELLHDHGFENLNASQVSALAEDLAEYVGDPLRYVTFRQSDDGLLERIRRGGMILQVLRDDAEDDEGFDRYERAESEKAVGRHENDQPESPTPPDPPQTSTSNDWPPEGYEHPSRWKSALEELRGQMAPEAYGHWIEPIAVAQLDGRRAELVVKEAFQAEWIGGKYADLIREALDVDDLTIRTPSYEEAS